MKKMTIALSIAGFDGSGGAGIQADLKTFCALRCYGTTVLTALPIQNTQGVKTCHTLPESVVRDQITTIFEDMTPDVIKIGMLFSESMIHVVADLLSTKSHIPIVLDPVMVAKSGHPLLQKNAVEALKTRLLPLSTLVTPNLLEAHALTAPHGSKKELAEGILNFGSKAVLIKGGHHHPQDNELFCEDLFMDQEGHMEILKSMRINTKNTHGTGCTLSAAIAAFLAKGHHPLEACKKAKIYLTKALEAAACGWSVGKGQGPVHHFHDLWPCEALGASSMRANV